MRSIDERLGLATAVAVLVSLAQAGLAAPVAADAPREAGGAPTVEVTFPGLSSGPLRLARVSDLDEGVACRSSAVVITKETVTAAVENAPQRLREQFRKNAFFVLEQLAAREVLLHEARAWAADEKRVENPGEDDKLLQSYLAGIARGATVTEEELKRFYEENQDIVGGVPFADIRGDLELYLLEQKGRAAVDAHIAGIGGRERVEVDRGWSERHYRLAMDNPVDRARRSGRPTLVDFGAKGCAPCDMMTPILASLREKYDGKANVLFVHVNDEPALAARYGIGTIPVQVFFDDAGKEVLRHEGFYPQAEIERTLVAIGVAR